MSIGRDLNMLCRCEIPKPKLKMLHISLIMFDDVKHPLLLKKIGDEAIFGMVMSKIKDNIRSPLRSPL